MAMVNPYKLNPAAWAHLPVSVGLETMGLDFDAPVFAIGAVRFTEDGSALPEGCPGEFYRLISLKGQAPVEISTLYWWLQQSPEAQAELKLSETADSVLSALNDFTAWLTGSPAFGNALFNIITGKKFEGAIWVRGDRDSAWLEHLFKRVACVDIPYRYNKVRDQRTLLDFAERHMNMDVWVERTTPMHHALHDARYQAECLQQVFKRYPNLDHVVEPE